MLMAADVFLHAAHQKERIAWLQHCLAMLRGAKGQSFRRGLVTRRKLDLRPDKRGARSNPKKVRFVRTRNTLEPAKSDANADKDRCHTICDGKNTLPHTLAHTHTHTGGGSESNSRLA